LWAVIKHSEQSCVKHFSKYAEKFPEKPSDVGLWIGTAMMLRAHEQKIRSLDVASPPIIIGGEI